MFLPCLWRTFLRTVILTIHNNTLFNGDVGMTGCAFYQCVFIQLFLVWTFTDLRKLSSEKFIDKHTGNSKYK